MNPHALPAPWVYQINVIHHPRRIWAAAALSEFHQHVDTFRLGHLQSPELLERPSMTASCQKNTNLSYYDLFESICNSTVNKIMDTSSMRSLSLSPRLYTTQIRVPRNHGSNMAGAASFPLEIVKGSPPCCP